MPDSVFEMMKATAVAAIPHYLRDLDSMERDPLQQVLSVLQSQQGVSPASRDYLSRLGASADASRTELEALRSEDLLGLHEAIQVCWTRFDNESEKRAIRQVFQLIAAHFFVHHLEDIHHDPAA